jgi:hypothetical protein
MAVELITKDDLIKFKQDLFSELKQILQGHNPDQKQWLKSFEVIEMLGISRGTLQTLRNNGTLTATKIGGLMFYSYEDIQKLMQGKRSKRFGT